MPNSIMESAEAVNDFFKLDRVTTYLTLLADMLTEYDKSVEHWITVQEGGDCHNAAGSGL